MADKVPIIYRFKLRNGEVYDYSRYGQFFLEKTLWFSDDFYYSSCYWRNGVQVRIYKER